MSKQRTAYRAGSLAQDRIDRLDSIGFKWALKEAQACRGRLDSKSSSNTRQSTATATFQRAGTAWKWVDKQRTNYKKGKLSQDRIDRLNGIGFDWTPPRGGSRKRKAPKARDVLA